MIEKFCYLENSKYFGYLESNLMMFDKFLNFNSIESYFDYIIGLFESLDKCSDRIKYFYGNSKSWINY